MSNWIRANYRNSEVEDRVYLSTLTELFTQGRYNVFKMDSGGTCLVVFNDQVDLLKYIRTNIMGVFALKFLLTTNNKRTYVIDTQAGPLVLLTLARALSVYPGTKTKRTLYSGMAEDSEIVIE